MFRSKKFSLLMALVFAFTVIMPVGAAFAGEDNTDISGTYNYVETGEDVKGGNVRVVSDTWEFDTNDVVVQLSLPEGVDFTDDGEAEDSVGDWVYANLDGGTFQSLENYTENTDYELVNVSSDYVEIKFVSPTEASFKAEFDFGKAVSDLEIDDDFTGNLDVAVDVIGINTGTSESITFTDNADVTIAKVSGGEVDVVVGDTKKVSIGGNEEVSDITLEESMAGAFNNPEEIKLEIETDGVEFKSVKVDSSRLDISRINVDTNGDESDVALTDGDEITAFEEDNEVLRLKVTGNSESLPGEIALDPIKLDIAPDVSGEIEISITSDEDGADIDETVTVATVGDVTAEVADIEDNDSTAYAGQDTDLDVSFDLKTTDGSDFEEGDMVIFELNKGKFANKPSVDLGDADDVDLYNDDASFYYTFPDDTDEITVDEISVVLDNDAEAGDLTLAISGDYGDLEEVVIGQVAKPFTVTADKTEILAEALGQDAGDITITEAADGAFVKDQHIYVEMPSGIELSGKPSIEVTEGSADADIEDYDEDFFVVKITEESSSEPSTLRVYDLQYDTGKLALTGDVELEFRGDIDETLNNNHTDYGDALGTNEDKKVEQDGEDWEFDDESIFAVVANASVVDQNAVTASFTVGDEGVAIKNGRTLVQVNLLTEVLGLQKSWDAASKTAYFVKDGKVVAFPIGQNVIMINGTELPVDQGGVIIDGATYATLRGIQAAFGGELTWDGVTKTATFNF